MGFDLDAARKDGATDEEIKKHLSSLDPSFNIDAALKDNVPLQEIADHIYAQQQKGGENNEQNKNHTQQQARETQLDNGGQTQVNQQGGQQVAQGIPTSNKNEPVQNNGSPVNQQGGSTPPVEGGESIGSKAKDFAVGTLSSMGQGIYKALEGLYRTEPEFLPTNDGAIIKNPRYEDEQKIVSFFDKQKKAEEQAPSNVGAKELTGKTKTASDVTGALLELPAQVATGAVGFAAMIAQGFGGTKENLYEKAKQEGKSDNDALNEATIKAGAITAAALPLYYLGGKVAGVATDKLIADSAPTLAKAATRVGINTVANTISSAVVRGVDASLSGEDIKDAVKDFSAAGVVQDFAFAAHSTVEHFKEQSAKGNQKEAVKDLPDPILEQVSKDPRYTESATKEIQSRQQDKTARQAASVGLPKTAEVIKEGGIVAPMDDRKVASAAYLAPDGVIYEGKDHLEAMGKAKDAGAITQEDIDAKKEPSSRNTDEFGFVVTNPDGTRTATTREAAGEIAKGNGQATTDSFVHGDKMHSNEVKYPSEDGNQSEFPGAQTRTEAQNRVIGTAARELQIFSEKKNPLDKNNPDHFEQWKKEFSGMYDEGTFTDDELKDIWEKAHEVHEISKKGVPIPEAVKQIGTNQQERKESVGIKNASVDKRREQLGLTPLFSEARKGHEQSWDNAVKKIDENPQYQDELISEVKKNPRILNDEEQLVIAHRLVEVQNEHDLLSLKIAEETDPSKIQKMRWRQEELMEQREPLDKILRSAGTYSGRALAIRKALIANDYSLMTMLGKAKAAKGENLTPEEEEKIKGQADTIKKSTEKADASLEKDKEKAQKEDIDRVIQTTKRSKVGSKKSPQTPDQRIEKAKSRIKDKKEEPSDVGSSIRAIAKAFIEKGITDRDALVDAVHGVVKPLMGDNWKRGETMDAISGYGKYHQLTKDATSNTLRKIGGELLQLGKIRDIITGSAPQKTGGERRKVEAQERILIKQVNALIKRFDIKVKDPETQLKGSMDAIKSRLKNQIEELQKRIQTGERPPGKTPVEYDQEAQALKESRDTLQLAFDTMYGRPEVSMEQRVKAAEMAYQRLIETKKNLISKGEYESKTTPKDEVTSERIKQHKAELETLNAELKAMKAQDFVRIEEEKNQRIVDRIKEIRLRLNGGEVKEKPQQQGADTQKTAALKEELQGLQKELQEKNNPKKTPDEKKLDQLEKQIADLTEKIANGDYSSKPIKYTVDTKAVSETKAKRDALLEKINQEKAKLNPKKTEDEKKADSLRKRIESIQKQLVEGKAPPKKVTPTADTEEVAALKNELETLNNEKKSAEWYQIARGQAATRAYEARLIKAKEDYERRTVEKDFAPRVRPKPILSEQTQRFKDEAQKAKDDFQNQLKLHQYNNRSFSEKAQDTLAKWKRFAVLSHLGTFEKLASASFEVAAVRPFTEFNGWLLGHLPIVNLLTKSVRDAAPIEGRASAEDISNYIKGLKLGAKETLKIVKGVRTELESQFEKENPYPKSWMDVPSRLHQASKNPTLRANYEMALGKYLDWAQRQGLDYRDPAVLEKASIEAYKYAKRSIYTEDNALIQWYNRNVVEGADKFTTKNGDRPLKPLATAFRVSLPIVKIPLNFAKQAFEYQFGTLIGGSKILAKAISGQMKNIAPEEADTIMRQLKNGNAGLAMMAIGAAFPNVFGGFYQRGEDKGDEDAPTGGARIAGHNISKQIFDHPLFIAAQVGATVRKFYDSQFTELPSEKAKALATGIAHAQLGLLGDIPFLSVGKDTQRFLNPDRWASGVAPGEILSQNTPGFISDFAKFMDKDEDGKTIKREPEDFMQSIEMGLPFVRKNVPPK